MLGPEQLEGGESREAQGQRCLLRVQQGQRPGWVQGFAFRGGSRDESGSGEQKATTLEEPATGGSADAEGEPEAPEVKVQGGGGAATGTREPAGRQEESRRFQGEGGTLGVTDCHGREAGLGSQSIAHRASVGWTHSGSPTTTLAARPG